VCVCVCVCACARARAHAQGGRTACCAQRTPTGLQQGRWTVHLCMDSWTVRFVRGGAGPRRCPACSIPHLLPEPNGHHPYMRVHTHFHLHPCGGRSHPSRHSPMRNTLPLIFDSPTPNDRSYLAYAAFTICAARGGWYKDLSLGVSKNQEKAQGWIVVPERRAWQHPILGSPSPPTSHPTCQMMACSIRTP